jgi:hypothetical protein
MGTLFYPATVVSVTHVCEPNEQNFKTTSQTAVVAGMTTLQNRINCAP